MAVPGIFHKFKVCCSPFAEKFFYRILSTTSPMQTFLAANFGNNEKVNELWIMNNEWTLPSCLLRHAWHVAALFFFTFLMDPSYTHWLVYSEYNRYTNWMGPTNEAMNNKKNRSVGQPYNSREGRTLRWQAVIIKHFQEINIWGYKN